VDAQLLPVRDADKLECAILEQQTWYAAATGINTDTQKDDLVRYRSRASCNLDNSRFRA
jgi:hypothetical protein